MKRSRAAVFVWLLTGSLGAFFVVYAVMFRPDGWGLFVCLGVVAVAGGLYTPAWKAAVE